MRLQKYRADDCLADAKVVARDIVSDAKQEAKKIVATAESQAAQNLKDSQRVRDSLMSAIHAANRELQKW